MCGIGGILRVTPPGEEFVPIPDEWADALDESIRHRGPDGHGRFRDKATRADGSIVEVVLVHRRLSIIDHEGGAQPMVSESGPDGMGRVAVVFNGCLYNHRELRAELEERGHVFKSDHSDTEVWVHLWREETKAQPDRDIPDIGIESYRYWALWERSTFTEPDGMFAVGIWDHDRACLSVFNDQHDEKPLYVHDQGGITIFSSSVLGVREVASRACASTSLDRDAVADWICLGFDGPCMPWGEIRTRLWQTVFPARDSDDIEIGTLLKWILFTALFVLPLALLIYGISNANPWSTIAAIAFPFVAWLAASLYSRYRNYSANQRAGGPVVRHASNADALLADSVHLRLDADVPVGCFLSGGIDSSLISKYAHEVDPTIKTFCVRMPDERYDESRYAQRVADIIGCEHHTLDVSPDPARDLVHLITELGLPFGDSSILPTYWLCKAAREHVKVALSGDGGDELFIGYERQIAARWLRWARWLGPLAPVVRSRLDRSDPKGRGDKAARFLDAARGYGYTDLVAIFPKREREALLGGSVGGLCKKRVFGGIDRAVDFDRGVYLPGDLLRKVDTASMSVGLEVRCPFLSRGMWVHFGAIPPRYLAPRGKRKAVLREIAYQYFPKELVDRPKQGFSIPIGDWFRTDYGGMRTLLHEKLDRPCPFGAAHDVLEFNMDYVRSIISEHMDNRRDHAQRLFMLTSLAIWSDSLEN